MTLTRREWLGLAASGAAGLLLACGEESQPGGEGTGPPDDPPDDPPDTLPPPDDLPPSDLDVPDVLRRYFEHADLDDVRAVGAAYARLYGEDRAGLEAALDAMVEALGDAADEAAAVGVLEGLVAADLDSLTMRAVGGWLFAETEVRLCALTSVLLPAA